MGHAMFVFEGPVMSLKVQINQNSEAKAMSHHLCVSASNV
jgi:hypothetical protein